MKHTHPVVSGFSSLTLEELNINPLLNRNDTKFIFSRFQLPLLLEKLTPSFNILEIQNQRIFNYENLYFDTVGLFFYRQHHNQVRPRYKVRYRKYLEPPNLYFEIKSKNNKDRTLKQRKKVTRIAKVFSGPIKRMILEQVGVEPGRLIPTLNVSFSRITLGDQHITNRVTIDFDLIVGSNGKQREFQNMVIAEVKQPRFQPRAEFPEVMRSLGIPAMRMSKYCLGIIHTHPGVKHNRFKPRLLQINKLLSES